MIGDIVTPLTTLLLSFIAAVVTCVLFIIILNKDQEKHKRELDAWEKTLNNTLQTMQPHKDALKGHNAEIIPPDYRYRQAMDFIYNALRNQRAMTMQEAVNLYENYLRDNRLMAMQAEQARILDSINDTANAMFIMDMADRL